MWFLKKNEFQKYISYPLKNKHRKYSKVIYQQMYSDHEKNVDSALKVLQKELNPNKSLKFIVISGILSEVSADSIEIRNLTHKE